MTLMQTNKHLECLLNQRARQLAVSSFDYAEFVEAMPLMMHQYLPDTTELFVNASMAAFFGVHRDRLIGARWIERCAADQRAAVLDRLGALTPDRPVQTSDVEIRLGNGRTAWVRWTDRAAFTSDGRLRYYQSIGLDITATREAEAALRRLTRQLLHAEHLARLGSWEWDLATGQLAVSREWQEIHGYPFSTLMVDQLLPIADPDDLPAIQGAIAATIDGGAPYSLEHRIRRHDDGTVRWVRAYGEVVTDADGQRRFFGAAQDITAEKEAARARALGEAQVRSLFTIAPDAILLSDPERRIVLANRQACTQLGYREAELLALKLDDVFSAPLADTLGAETGGAGAGAPLASREGWIRRKDGRAMPVDVRASGYRLDGRRYLFAAARDISERKATERLVGDAHRKIEVALNGIDTAVFVAELDTAAILFANDAARRTFGSCVGRMRAELLQCGAESMAAAPADGALVDAHGRPTPPFVCEIADAGGSRWFDCRTRAIRWTDGRWVRLQTVSDITERKKIEDSLAAARAAAEASSAAKSSFLACMSHELRTPLTSILGFSELLASGRRRLGDAVVRQYAGYIQEAGRHLHSLINDILDIAKIEVGKLEIEPTELPVAQLVDRVVKLQREKATNDGLTLTAAPIADGLMIWADARAAKQILFNLISNAIKFSKAGGEIEVAAVPCRDGGVALAVADTGIGIPPDQLARIVKPFEQMDNRYTRAAGGTGLGLSLVKGLIDLHGGTLEIASTPGRGTTVTAWFPPPGHGAPAADAPDDQGGPDQATSGI